jgi:predicted nucleic acid-binding protein
VHGYLLDTNIVAFWLDARRPQHQRVGQRIQELPPEAPLMVSAITLGEIEYGLRVVSQDSTAWQEALRDLVDRRLPMVLDISKATCMYYGLLRARLFEKYAPRHRRRTAHIVVEFRLITRKSDSANGLAKTVRSRVIKPVIRAVATIRLMVP